MEQYQVKPLTDFLPVYKDKHRIIVRAIEDRDDLSIEEKLQLYELEVGKLKTQFSSDRKAEYESKSIELSVGHSCTSSSSGGVKNCGWKCVTAPVEGLYTIKEWTRVEGTNKGVSVSANQACLKMTVSGSGRNSGTLFATFKYEPTFISTTTEKETISLFNLIISVVDSS
jgi:hypothetical protein